MARAAVNDQNMFGVVNSAGCPRSGFSDLGVAAFCGLDFLSKKVGWKL